MALREQELPALNAAPAAIQLLKVKDNRSNEYTTHFDAITAWTTSVGEDQRTKRLRIYLANGSTVELFDAYTFVELMKKHYGSAFDTLFVSQTDSTKVSYFLRADDIFGWLTRQGDITTVHMRGGHQIAGLTIPLEPRVLPLRRL